MGLSRNDHIAFFFFFVNASLLNFTLTTKCEYKLCSTLALKPDSTFQNAWEQVRKIDFCQRQHEEQKDMLTTLSYCLSYTKKSILQRVEQPKYYIMPGHSDVGWEWWAADGCIFCSMLLPGHSAAHWINECWALFFELWCPGTPGRSALFCHQHNSLNCKHLLHPSQTSTRQ